MGTVYGGKPVFGGGIAPVSHNAEVEDARERFTPGDLKGGAGKRGWTALARGPTVSELG